MNKWVLIFFTLFLGLGTSVLLATPKQTRAADTNVITGVQGAVQIGQNAEAWINQVGLVAPVVNLITAVAGNLTRQPNGLWSFDMKGSMLATAGDMVAMTYTPPASGVQYLADSWGSMFGKPAYAQGAGFQSLSPILPMWKLFRDLTYVISSFFFVIVGLMIIFRVKLNPQTVISIQSAIPSLVGTLLLITFSYAIAGLLIDITNLLQGVLLAGMFVHTNGGDLTKPLIDFTIPVLNANVKYGTFSQLATGGSLEFAGALALVPAKTVAVLIAEIFNTLIGQFLGISGGVGAAIGVGVAIFVLILLLALAFSLLSLFLALARCYVLIIFKIIIGPLEIMAGAIPGSKTGFSSWIKELFANIIVFPVVYVYVIILDYIVMAGIKNGPLWSPNVLNLPVIGNPLAQSTVISMVFGICGVLILGQLPKMIPQVLFAIKPGPWETAIGQTQKDIVGGPAPQWAKNVVSPSAYLERRAKDAEAIRQNDLKNRNTATNAVATRGQASGTTQ